MSTAPTPIPRLPVFGWASLTGRRATSVPTMLNMRTLRYTTSGRASILLALEALGVSAGDRVLLPTYHCPTMVAPVLERAATPQFYPIDEKGAPDLAWLSTQSLVGVRALLAAHFFGFPQPMAALRRWCDDRGIALIEDCAHALFGRSGERDIGAWGDFAIGSLPKFLPVAEGGCLAVNGGTLTPALTRCGVKAELKAVLDIFDEGARHQRLAGLNAAIAGVLAALRRLRGGDAPPTDATVANGSPSHGSFAIDSVLAHRELTRSSRWIARYLPTERVVRLRRRRYAELVERLSGHAGLRPLFPDLPAGCVPYVLPLWVDKPDPGYAELRRLKMPVYRWDDLWHEVPHWPADHGTVWSHHVLQLACHQDLTDDEIELFAATLLRLFAQAHTPAPSPAAPRPQGQPLAGQRRL